LIGNGSQKLMKTDYLIAFFAQSSCNQAFVDFSQFNFQFY
jgi:hypothetical protein